MEKHGNPLKTRQEGNIVVEAIIAVHVILSGAKYLKILRSFLPQDDTVSFHSNDKYINI